MNVPHRIFKNTVYQLGGQFSHLILNVVTIAMIARYLGVNGYGKFSLILMILSFFVILTDFGVNDIVVRELSRDKIKTSRIVFDLFLLKLLLGIVSLGLSIFVFFLLNYPKEDQLIFAWASVALIFNALSSIGSNIVFKANLWMERSVIAILAKDLSFLVSIYLVIFIKGGLLEFIWAFLVANFVHLCMTLVLMRNVISRPLPPFDLGYWKKILRNAFPLGLAYLVVSLYAGIDTVFLAKLAGEKSVGYYNAAYKFVFQAVFIPIAFTNSIFPFMSEYWINNKEKLNVLFQKAYDFMVIIAIPLAVVVTIIAPKLILLIYGKEYTPSILALQILIWGVAVMFQSVIFGYMMVALNEQRKSIIINIWGLIVNISLNLILIPLYTFIGASIATVITEIAVIVPTIIIIQNKTNYTLSLVMLYKSFFIAIPCALLLLLTNSLNLFVQLSICILGYISFGYFLQIIPKKDMQLLWQGAKARYSS